MALTFFGPWRVEFISKDAAFAERFVISGSTASDGAYAIDATTPPVRVDGARWAIELEWNDNLNSGWLPSDVRKLANNTLDEGLIITLGADDNFPSVRDGDFNDAVIRLRNLNPALNPWLPFGGHPDFVVREKPKGEYPDRPSQSHEPRHR